MEIAFVFIVVHLRNANNYKGVSFFAFTYATSVLLASKATGHVQIFITICMYVRSLMEYGFQVWSFTFKTLQKYWNLHVDCRRSSALSRLQNLSKHKYVTACRGLTRSTPDMEINIWEYTHCNSDCDCCYQTTSLLTKQYCRAVVYIAQVSNKCLSMTTLF